MRLFLKTAIIPMLLSLRPGEPVAILTCKSNSIEIFRAILPQLKYLESAELTNKNSKIEFSLNDSVNIAFEPSKKIFQLKLKSIRGGNRVDLSAIPSTFKMITNKKGPGTQFHKVYAFKALLKSSTSINDRSVKDTVTVNCTLDYEL